MYAYQLWLVTRNVYALNIYVHLATQLYMSVLDQKFYTSFFLQIYIQLHDNPHTEEVAAYNEKEGMAISWLCCLVYDNIMCSRINAVSWAKEDASQAEEGWTKSTS